MLDMQALGAIFTRKSVKHRTPLVQAVLMHLDLSNAQKLDVEQAGLLQVTYLLSGALLTHIIWVLTQCMHTLCIAYID